MEIITRLLEQIYKNPDQTVLIVCSIFALLVVVYWHTDKKTDFDLRHLMMDSRTGRVSIFKVGQVIALMVSTWILIHETKLGRITEWLFGAYMAIWSGSNLLKRYIDKTKNTDNTENTK